MKIAVLQGPNLNRLGRRNPAKYGPVTLAEITADLDKTAAELDVDLDHLQSNSEAALIDFVHHSQDDWAGIVINPAGLSAAAYSLLDAVRDTELPYAVVHISQWHAIDAKERTDIFAGTAAVYVAGAGWRGYSMALDAIVHKIRGD
jgi:3-dehydroquinate dehydratase II